MRLKNSLKLMALGAAAYPLLELAWRGRTAPSMAAAGGTGMMVLDQVNKKMRRRPLWQKSLVGGIAITGMEYMIGRMINRRHQIWDYSTMPFHVEGQICPQYAALWCLMTLPVFAMLGRGRR